MMQVPFEEPRVNSRISPPPPHAGRSVFSHAASARASKNALRAPAESPARLMQTFWYAPAAAARAICAPTPASESDACMPIRAISRLSSMSSGQASSTRSGTSAAPTVASASATSRTAASSGVDFGMRIASSSASKAAVSASTAASSWSLSSCARTAMRSSSGCFVSKPFLRVRQHGHHRRQSRGARGRERGDRAAAGRRRFVRELVERTRAATSTPSRGGDDGEPVLDHALFRIERLHLDEAERADGDVHRAPLRATPVGRPILREVVAAGVEQHLPRHEADDLRAGDAQAALARALFARVEDDVQRRDVEIGEVDRDLRAAELRDHPADRLHRLEQSRLPDRLALFVEHRLAVRRRGACGRARGCRTRRGSRAACRAC